MQLEEFRTRVEGKSGREVGSAIREALRTEQSSANEECTKYLTMLEIVSNELLGIVSETDKVRNMLAECRTSEEVSYLISDLNFGKYNQRGIPISRMVTERLKEIYGNQDKKLPLLRRIAKAVFG